jgi:hypothetical protein
MLSNTKTFLIVVAIVLGFTLIAVLFVNYLGSRSSARLNLLLEKIEIGLPLPKVIERLGKPARVLTKVEDIEEWGTIKDKKVLEACDLYMFPYQDIPHKYILVYVTKNSNKVYIVKVVPM